MSHFVVSAIANEESVYQQPFGTMLDALHDIGDLMFHDDTKLIRVEKCCCSNENNHREGR